MTSQDGWDADFSASSVYSDNRSLVLYALWGRDLIRSQRFVFNDLFATAFWYTGTSKATLTSDNTATISTIRGPIGESFVFDMSLDMRDFSFFVMETLHRPLPGDWVNKPKYLLKFPDSVGRRKSFQ